MKNNLWILMLFVGGLMGIATHGYITKTLFVWQKPKAIEQIPVQIKAPVIASVIAPSVVDSNGFKLLRCDTAVIISKGKTHKIIEFYYEKINP